jgi:hypothetical protein
MSMSDMTDPDGVEPITRTCQIIVVALAMGVLTFLAIVVLLDVGPGNPAPGQGGQGIGGASLPLPGGGSLPLMTALAVVLGIIGLVMSFTVPRVFVAGVRRTIAREAPPRTTAAKASEPAQVYPAGDTGRLLPVYQTQLIMGAAINEGMAFFAAIAYMLERHPIALGTAIVLLGGLVARFPTADRVNAWLDRELSLLQAERQSVL